MKNLMISILTAIVLSLLMQPASAQNLQLEKGVTHPHTIMMVDDSRMQLMIESFFAGNPEQMHAIAGDVLKDSPMANMVAECMKICHGDEEARSDSVERDDESEDHDNHH